MTFIHASLHGCRAFVPGKILGDVTDILDDETGWYPMSVEKIRKEDKTRLYNKLKLHPDWGALSRQQKKSAKKYIKYVRDLTMPQRSVLEAIIHAKRCDNEAS